MKLRDSTWREKGVLSNTEKINDEMDILKSGNNMVETDSEMISISENSDPLNLYEELNVSVENATLFECNYGEKSFVNRNAFKNHERKSIKNKY